VKPEVVATGIQFPEGPVWCPADGAATGTIVCTSVADGSLERVHVADGRVERVATLGGGANAAAPCRDGGYLVTQNGGIDFSSLRLYADDPPRYEPVTPGIQRVAPDGTVTYLNDRGFLAPNDLVVTDDETLWFTDPPHYPPSGEPSGRIHAMAPDGTTRVVASGFQYCNGIARDPQGTLVIVEGLGLQRLRPDGSRDWIVEQLPDAPGDGLCVDTDGRIYVANTTAHGVRVLDADGRELEFLTLDGRGTTTNCCFGGADGRTLFATDGVPGSIVAWEGLPAPGVPVRAWAGP